MSKAFLVRSVRDSIRRMLDYSGAEIGESERDRAEMRERIQRMLEDPAELAVFRTLLADAAASYDRKNFGTGVEFGPCRSTHW